MVISLMTSQHVRLLYVGIDDFCKLDSISVKTIGANSGAAERVVLPFDMRRGQLPEGLHLQTR